MPLTTEGAPYRTLVCVSHEELRPTDPVKVGDAQLVGRLGEGGMGVVYLGRLQSGQAVAVKMLKPSLCDQEGFRDRFAAEVAAMRILGGRCAAELLSADLQDSPPWFIMEFIHGPTLSEYVHRNGPLSSVQVRALGVALSEALCIIHAEGISHRDFKPSNVVLSPEGPRLLDFGVARAPAHIAAITEHHVRVGSLTWMSPEQIQGKPVTSACDVHGLAMVLFFAATGRPLYGYGQGDAVAWRILNTEPHLDDLPSELSDWTFPLQLALAKDPEDRITTTEFCRVLGGQPIVAHTRVEPVEQATRHDVDPTQQVRAPTVQPTAVEPQPAPPPRSPNVIPAAAVATEPAAAWMSPSRPTPQRATKPRRRFRWITSIILFFITLWLVGWFFGAWALIPTSSFDNLSGIRCVTSTQQVNFNQGNQAASSGTGQATNVWSGGFPGPFGEFRIPVHAIECQLGAGVRIKCPQYTLAPASSASCIASDSSGNKRTVTVQRSTDTYQWSVA